MVLKEADIKRIVNFVKAQPRTIQEIAKFIHKSWLTADSYVKQIKDDTGLIDIRTFRAGTQGALKIAFYNHSETLQTDDIRESLYSQIKAGRWKEDFDFMEIFQYIPDEKKHAFSDEIRKGGLPSHHNFIPMLKKAKEKVLLFSGNLSFINIQDKDEKAISVIESLLKAKVSVKILARVTITSLENLNKLQMLMKRYPGLLEIRHCYHPLRGGIIDDDFAQFKVEEEALKYRPGELEKNKRVFYQITDKDWISWLQKVFWNLFRVSIGYEARIKELKKIF